MVEIFTPNRHRIVATIVVRDEADIIGPMIEHHVDQGITDFLVTDNASKDETPAILGHYPEVRSIEYSNDMTHNQEIHVTRMAREACKLNPEWICHMDADEFWCDLSGVHAESHSHMALWSPIAYVHPPVPGLVEGIARLDKMKHYIDFRGKAPEYKVMHRPLPDVEVAHGNHFVRGLETGYTLRVHRHHYPIRSYDQFLRKVVQGATALKARGMVCERWYTWLETWEKGGLEALYETMTTGWKDMLNVRKIEKEKLRTLLVNAYGVQQETAAATFDSLSSAGLEPLIGSWIPATFTKRRQLFG